MKIIYFTPQAPSLKTGGGLHCYANLRSLCAFPGACVSYVGPPIDEPLDGLEFLTPTVSRHFRFADKVRALVAGASTSLFGLYREWRATHGTEADLAFVEFTKAGFAVSELSRQVFTICNAHNVELDYMRSGARGLARLAVANIAVSEELSVRASHRMLFMHNADLARMKAVYRTAGLDAKALLHPVCSMSAAEPLPYPSRSRRVVIPGSLDQHYNEQGIVAFLDEAWPALRSLHVDLVIAGRNPRPALLAAARRAGVLVIENPLSMPNIVRDSLAVLVPDLGGAGMKLRVAEALGAGVPVVGTEAGLLGYEDVSSFGRTVSNIASMGEALREVLGSTQTGERLARGAREAWVCRYSFGAFSERLHGWLSSWGRGSP